MSVQKAAEEVARNFNKSYLVEQIDLRIGVAGITRVPEQQLNEAHECVERVKALHSDTCHDLARLRQRPVAQVNTHLRA